MPRRNSDGCLLTMLFSILMIPFIIIGEIVKLAKKF